MKRAFCLLLTLAVLIGALPVYAEDENFAEIAGQITELGEDYLLIDDLELGEVHVWLNEETVYEGAEPSTLAVGQYAAVLYDGKMTRSLPPQITALYVGVHSIRGEVVAICEDYVLIEQGDGLGEVIVRFAREMPELTVGESVIVYTYGMMTMSLPPQVSAIGVQAADAAESAEEGGCAQQ